MLVKGDSLLDKGIEWAETGVYSHVAIYAGHGYIYETQGGEGVAMTYLSKYDGRYDVGHIRATQEQRRKMVQYYASKVGKPYGWLYAFLTAVELLFHIRIKWKHKLIPDCSGMYNEAAQYAGLLLCKKFYPTPQDIADSVAIQIERVSKDADTSTDHRSGGQTG